MTAASLGGCASTARRSRLPVLSSIPVRHPQRVDECSKRRRLMPPAGIVHGETWNEGPVFQRAHKASLRNLASHEVGRSRAGDDVRYDLRIALLTSSASY